MLTEGCRNANDQAFALEFFGQIDLVPRRVLHETIEVGDRVADLHSGGGSRVEGGTWARPDGSGRSWHNTAQRSCFVHGVNGVVNGVRYSGGGCVQGDLRSQEQARDALCSRSTLGMDDMRRRKVR